MTQEDELLKNYVKNNLGDIVEEYRPHRGHICGYNLRDNYMIVGFYDDTGWSSGMLSHVDNIFDEHTSYLYIVGKDLEKLILGKEL